MPVDQRRFEDQYLKDAERGLMMLGYKVAVFSFDYVPEEFSGIAAPHEIADVIVTNTETQMQKAYHRGPGVAWHTSFMDDLRAGQFGAPPRGLDAV